MEKNGAQDDFFQAFFDPMRAFFQKTSKENRAQRQWMGGLHLIIIWKPDTAYPVAQRPALYFYFSFSNRNKPNFAKNIRIFRISSVRAYFTVGPQYSHVMPAWACAVAGICGCGRIQQPCHPHAGMCGGMGSMAAAYHCHPS